MKPLRLTQLLVPILLLSFSDGWAQSPPPVEIKEVLNLFSGSEATWPVQHGDRWCWAASAEIIMSSYGRTSWKQCIQADDAYPGKSWPRTCCDSPEGPGSPLCNRTGWPRFEYYGFHYSRTSEALTWEELKEQIDQNQPMAVAVKYTDPTNRNISHGGHMGVVAGYAESSDGEHKILIVDPDGFHGGMWALYEDIFGTSSDFSRHWRTYYDIRPLP